LIAINGGTIQDKSTGYFEIEAEAGTHLYRIHTKNAAPGVYTLKLLSEEFGVKTFKVILN
jgi:hypothetical protein